MDVLGLFPAGLRLDLRHGGDKERAARRLGMSDSPVPPKPLMGPAKARDIARDFKAWSEHLHELGLTAEASRAERDSQWWLIYSIALSQIPPGRVET